MTQNMLIASTVIPLSYIQLLSQHNLKMFKSKLVHLFVALVSNYYQSCCIARCIFISGWAWPMQLVRSLLSDHKVPGSIPALPRFEYLCDLCVNFPSFRGR